VDFKDLQVREVAAVLRQPPELAGTWEIHVLTMDLVTYGATPTEALEMGADAIVQAISHDLERRLDPFERCKAPEECWKDYHLAKALGQPLPLTLLESMSPAAAKNLVVAVDYAAWALTTSPLLPFDGVAPIEYRRGAAPPAMLRSVDAHLPELCLA
jgi:hypothetical protein